MSVAVIYSLLSADSALLLLVPVGRIYSGVIPQNTVAPCIAITEISTFEVPTVDANSPSVIASTRVQVTVIAKNYPQQKQLLDAVRKACNYERGTIAGVSVISVRRAGDGPDFFDGDAGLCMQTTDFRVTWLQSN